MSLLRPAKRKIPLSTEGIERVVYPLRRRFRRKYRVLRANLILSFFHLLERPRGEKSENRRTQTDDALARNENRPIQHIRVDLIEYVVFLRNATCIDHALDVHTMLGHAIQDDPSMQGSAFDRRKQFILGGALQVPTEGNPSQVRVYKHRAVSVDRKSVV